MNVNLITHWRSLRAETYPLSPMSVSHAPFLTLVALASALAYPGPVAGAQQRSIAGGERIGLRTARHGWIDGSFHDIRGDTIVLALRTGAGAIAVPYDSILGFRVPEGRRFARTARHALLGGLAGAMVGAAVGFDGATKVTAPREVRRGSLQFGLGGVAVGGALGARARWRDVRVALMRAAPGEEMLVMREVNAAQEEGWVAGSTATSATDRATITRSELESMEGVTALDAIRRLRPEFLRSRRAELARQALVLPVVYLDGTKLGELGLLESIHLRSVLEIQYFSPTEASMRWGLGHEGGVIHVMLRRA